MLPLSVTITTRGWSHPIAGHVLLQGSVILRTKLKAIEKHLEDGAPMEGEVTTLMVCHDDIISRNFWDQHPELLAY